MQWYTMRMAYRFIYFKIGAIFDRPGTVRIGASSEGIHLRNKRQHPQDEFEWDYIIPSDDPERGGKLAAFVLHLMDDTSLVYTSIQNYVWGWWWWWW